MSTRAKFAASIASAGVVAVGWYHYAGAAPRTATAAQPVTTTTVTVTKTPSAAKTNSSSASTSKSSSKTSSTTAKRTSSAATSSTSTTQAQTTTRARTTTQAQSGNQARTTQTQAGSQQTTTASTGWRDGTYTGQTVQHQYGTVQVTVTISGGQISNLREHYTDPGDARSQYIDQQAIPMIKQEVLAADTANVSTIGGATFTTAAYLQSLQSALDQA